MEIVKEAGGRFLKDSGNGWEVVEDSVARLKVSEKFRAMGGKNQSMVAQKMEALTTKRIERCWILL